MIKDEIIEQLKKEIDKNNSLEFHGKYLEYLDKRFIPQNLDELKDIIESISNERYYFDELQGSYRKIYSLGWNTIKALSYSFDENIKQGCEEDEALDLAYEQLEIDAAWTTSQGAHELSRKLDEAISRLGL